MSSMNNSRRNRGKPSTRSTARPRRSRVSASSPSPNHPLTWTGSSTPPRLFLPDNTVYTLIDNAPPAYLNQVATYFTAGAIAFQLSYLSQYTQLTAVFDQFRIDMVEVTFRPTYTSNPLSESSSTAVPSLYTVVDYADITIGSYTAANLLAYGNCTNTVYETVVRRFKPSAAPAMYNTGATFTAYGNLTSPWVDSNSYGAQHYGIKYGCDGGFVGQTNLQSWIITTRYMVSFRNVR